GDVGDPQILTALAKIAPVTAIRGNTDEGDTCGHLPATELIELAGRSIYLLHDVKKLDLNPEATGVAAVVFGHSHKPTMELRRGVLFLNPGSAGPRRFELPVSIGWLYIEVSALNARIVTLTV
ncbi:MAG: metallophosphoesterase family protein, partial [Acidobacteriaceae bacterium]